ncbi:MAG: TonB-dependent receptor [Bryobacteraceae bacterium]|nr:TonB-dependent receptor [Bryobacteraceae bacterium]
MQPLRLLPILVGAFFPLFASTEINGVVRDHAGSPIADANVQVSTPVAGTSIGAILGQIRTADDGAFRWPISSNSGVYRIRVSAAGFTTREMTVSSPDAPIAVELAPEAIYTSVTVGASPDRTSLEDPRESASVVTVRGDEKLRSQPLPTLGHAIANEPGILLQQSTWGQASPFLRGLTGYQVLNLIDGIRFNNSTFRSGPNQYLAYIEPGQVTRLEATLGPSGVAWGSDALGGIINIATTQPEFRVAGAGVHGQLHLGAASADLSGTASGRLALSTPRFYWLGGLSGRRHNDLRAGGGFDSRNVFRRFFGLNSEQVQRLTGSRQQDSGFDQAGAEARFAMRLRPSQTLTLHYQRGAQSRVNAYKDLLGGLGRVISTFEPQALDFLYARYEKLGTGPIDSISGTFSFNGQTDGGRRQNLSFADPLTTDYARVKVLGYTSQVTAHVGSRLTGSLGGEFYDEYIESTREIRNPVSGVVTRPRPLYPNQSRYQNLGAFAQVSYRISRTLRAAGGVRATGVRFATPEDQALRIPRSSQWFRDVTFQSSLQWSLTNSLGLHALVGRGFRAPNLNDLGALGLNDLGYEIPAAEAIGAGAQLATDAGEGALAKGSPLRSLGPESLMNYELGMTVRTGRLYARAQFFNAELYNPIVRRTLLFSAVNVPTSLAGLPVAPIAPTAAQREQGVVTVATRFDPRAVKAFVNDGQSRYYGFETMAQVALMNRWMLEANYSLLTGRDLFPNRNIRRLPPGMGAARLRYTPSRRRPWVEVSLTAAQAQARLSGGDRDDERIGASFRRADIAPFFRGSRVAALTDPLTGVFRPTGETLAQIQNRVLPIGATINGVRVADDNSRVPLYLSTAGWAVVGLRSGLPIGERWSIHAAVENALDKNYRYHGSGVDAPGFNAWVGVRFAF